MKLSLVHQFLISILFRARIEDKSPDISPQFRSPLHIELFYFASSELFFLLRVGLFLVWFSGYGIRGAISSALSCNQSQACVARISSSFVHVSIGLSLSRWLGNALRVKETANMIPLRLSEEIIQHCKDDNENDLNCENLFNRRIKICQSHFPEHGKITIRIGHKWNASFLHFVFPYHGVYEVRDLAPGAEGRTGMFLYISNSPENDIFSGRVFALDERWKHDDDGSRSEESAASGDMDFHEWDANRHVASR